MKKVLIIAPHPDDEVIGCWSVLKNMENTIDVLYEYELTETRMNEARKTANILAFTPFFGQGPDNDGGKHWDVKGSYYDEIYIPCRQDLHPHHKQVNSLYRSVATHFYSVDMNAGAACLDKIAAEEKRDFLIQHYPSQLKLWDRDDKYWLFEHIRTTDFDIYETLLMTSTGGRKYKVLVLQEYAFTLQAFLDRGIDDGDNLLERQLFNRIVSLCPTGAVAMVTPEGFNYSIRS